MPRQETAPQPQTPEPETPTTPPAPEPTSTVAPQEPQGQPAETPTPAKEETSSTSTTLDPTREQLTSALKALQQTYEHLLAIYTKMPPPEVSEAAPEKESIPDPMGTHLEERREGLHPSDILLSFDIRLISKTEGELVRLHDTLKMAFITQQNMLSEAPRTFENNVVSNIWRPLNAAFQSHLQQFVTNDNALSAMSGTTHSQHVPTALPGAFEDLSSDQPG